MIDPQRGEVWRVRLDPVRGSEQAKTRPVVVLNAPGVGRPTVRICAPIMGWQSAHAAFFWCVKVEPNVANGLTKDSAADAAQIRALDVTRFADRLGALESDEVEAIAAAVALCVGFSVPSQETSL